MDTMNFSKDFWLIHIFALLHAAVSLGCGVIGIADDLMLTMLTMLLVVAICLRRRLGALFMAAAVVLVNIVGFGAGMGLAALFKLMTLPSLFAHAVSTFICTEIIGWSVEGAATLYLVRHPESGSPDSRSLRHLLVAFVLIIILRLVLLMATSGVEDTRNFFLEMLLDYIFSCVAIVWVAEYAIRSREEVEKTEAEANLAHFRYLKLKQQVNPHFLFNSLNVLDCMIQEQSTEEASRYTHMLADIYRYMIKNEEEVTVKLQDEMEFVAKYVGLLRVRFPKGLEVSVDIPPGDLSRSVVPCCVQLLIENATKHNAVSADRPLHIGIRTTRNSVMVSNNVNPKLSRPDSTGLGLKYLRQQYKDIAGKSVVVRVSEEYYTVILPLL